MTAEPVASPPGVIAGDPLAVAVRAATQRLAEHARAVLTDGDEEDVHQLRVAARRLRSDLKTFGPAVPINDLAGVSGELGWLGRAASGARDADVLADRLRSYASAVLVDPEDAARGRQLLDRLAAQRAAGGDEMLAALSSDRYRTLVRELDHLGDVLRGRVLVEQSLTDPDPIDALKRSARGFMRAAERAGADAPDEQLHRIRLRAKRLRYAADTVGDADRAVATLRRAAARIQDVLGDHQDTMIAERWLRRAAVALPETGLAAGLLIAAARTERTACRRFWARGKQLGRIAKAVDQLA